MSRVLVITLALLLTSCSTLNPLSAIPNPLEADKGINTNVALGKNVEANNTKGLVTLDKIDIGRDNSNTSQTTSTNTGDVSVSNYNGFDRRMLILVIVLVSIIILLAGMAIPTRGQANRINELKENLEYERERTNLVVEAAAERQKTGQA